MTSPYYFEQAAADAAVAFFPRFIRHVDGEWAGRPFHLADWQAHHTRQIFGWRHRKDGRRRYRFVRGWVPRKNGKGLALDTPLPTPSGWTTMGQVAVGDILYAETGEECLVTRVSDVRLLDCYEVEFSNSERVICDGDHLWLTQARVDRPGLGVGQGRQKSRKGETLTRRPRTTRELFETQTNVGRGDRNHSISMPSGICGRTAELQIDPYVFGLWLGDGTSVQAALTVGRDDCAEIVAEIKKTGIPCWISSQKGKTALSVRLTDGVPNGEHRDCFQARLRKLGVLGAKHIPQIYQRASLEQRIRLLQGLMDSDGHVAVHGNVIEVVTTFPVLGDGIAELLAGLGIKFSRRICLMRCNGRPVSGEAHRFQFCVSADLLPVFRLRRKAKRQKRGKLHRSRTVQIVAVRHVPTVPTKCIEVDSPSHLFRCGRTMLPTHNSAWAAGLGHLLTIGDGEPGAQVLCHALNAKQANVVYDMAARMVAFSQELTSLYEVTKTGMLCTAASNACYRQLSGEPYGQHGLNPHANIGDEAHVWKNGKLHTFLMQGMGARRQPLDITISTAGEIKTYGHELYETSKRIFEVPTLDPETYVFIYEADKNDDWTDPKTWAKANPNLGTSLKHSFLEGEFKQAIQSPRRENDFKRYHLNLWVEQSERWFPMHRWADNTACPQDKNYWKRLPEEMLHRKAHGGLDLGSTNDITCLAWVFPPGEGEGNRTVIVPQFWVPEETVAQRDSPRTPYKKWVADRALQTTPGNVTDYDFIEHQVMTDAGKFQVEKLGYDPWNATQVAVHLQDEGAPMVEFRQGFGSMAAPSKELERLFLSGQLEHGNHPVLEWMFGNATYRKDPAGNIKPDKERAAEKIDGVVATVMGLGLASAKQERKPSYQMMFV